MTIPFYCVVGAFILTFVSKVPVMKAQKDDGGYDNNLPRDQQARLTGWGRRAVAAHYNSIEAFPPFAVGVILAHLTGADPIWSARLAVAFLGFRVAYMAFYLGDFATLRSVVWFSGLLCSFALCALGAFK